MSDEVQYWGLPLPPAQPGWRNTYMRFFAWVVGYNNPLVAVVYGAQGADVQWDVQSSMQNFTFDIYGPMLLLYPLEGDFLDGQTLTVSVAVDGVALSPITAQVEEGA